MYKYFSEGCSVKETIDKMGWEYNEKIRGTVKYFKLKYKIRVIKMRSRINLSNCGDEIYNIQLLNHNSDIMMAKGNSKGIVIKVKY